MGLEVGTGLIPRSPGEPRRDFLGGLVRLPIGPGTGREREGTAGPDPGPVPGPVPCADSVVRPNVSGRSLWPHKTCGEPKVRSGHSLLKGTADGTGLQTSGRD